MKLSEIYDRHQKKILVLTPLVLAVAFVGLSSISALITINNTSIPENFEEVTSKVENYVLYELSPQTNEKKWMLKGASAVSDADSTSAIVSDVEIKAYKNNEVEFIMTSDSALANEATKDIKLMDNVKVTSPSGKFLLSAGGLNFSDDLDLMVDSNWDLNTNEGYNISGIRGIINKDLTSIVSTGNASVKKDKLNLTADKIVFKDKKPIVATGRANLKLDAQKSLKADNITFNLDGNVNAKGHVGVKTDKISCFSQILKILPAVNTKPKLAILEGSPYVIHNGRRIAADRITYDFFLNQVSAEGNVHTEIIR